MYQNQPSDLAALISGILALWIMGLGLAFLMGGPRLAGRYTTRSATLFFRTLRRLIAWAIETVGSFFHWVARSIR